ncbi:MAG: peptidoglycan DD-metalloendopeptidase family protein [Lutibacter sp.]|nr:peptidoglycan DD-metalloendopeptidase family protein [Lutibacter sp.]
MRIVLLLLLFLVINGCKESEKDTKPAAQKEAIVYEYGFKLNDFKVINDTVRSGENFSEILDRNHVDYPKVLEIARKIKDTFNVRKIKSGTAYTILASKDSSEQAKVFIYKHSKVRYTVVDFKDSVITAYRGRKPVKTVLESASGVISSSLYETMEAAGLNLYLAFEMSDIYAWTIDFFRLQKDDKFKILYEQLYLNDTVPVGIGDIKAVYFEHAGKPFYAFRYLADSSLNMPDYFDDKANNLRRQFLRAPVKFSRISSRYNLKRRIAYYGNKIRPHKGTDYAARVGTPIVSTANGRVIESRYKGGNGHYVKIRHNSTYSTQYLHMSKRAVKKGDYVKQGAVIGYVGMTGNTSGPHVCYRFWKNGRQVDPLKTALPAAKPMKKEIRPNYLQFIEPLQKALDSIPLIPTENNTNKPTKQTI